MPASSDSPEISPGKASTTSAAQISSWVGIIGSVVTIALTLWNVHTKSQIDQREADLQQLEIKLKERSAGVEESKERVDRYKWVLGLFPNLNSRDAKERNFTLNLARLALTKDEAEQLFASLQSSPDSSLRSIGESGIKSIQNEPISLLVSQMNAVNADARKTAVAKLSRDYASSAEAINITLRMYEEPNLQNISPSAVINGLYFLSTTDASAWDAQQFKQANSIVAKLEAKNIGAQTNASLTALKAKLKKVQEQLR